MSVETPGGAATALAQPLARARLGSCTLLVLLVALLASTAPTLARPWQGAESAPLGAWLALGAGALVLLATVWCARRLLLNALASLEFSIVLLAALLLCTVTGTLVLQGAAPEDYVARYGESGARFVAATGVGDLFHTSWFTSLLALLALSLGTTLVRTRAWRPERWGHLLAHGGVVVVLGGGLVGALFGAKGRLELREGQSVDRYVRTDVPGEVVPLGFTLRLDRFDLEHHADVWRVFQYGQDGGSWRPSRSWVPHEAGEWQDLGPDAGAFRVTRLLHDAGYADEGWVADAGAASLALELLAGDDTRTLTLWDGAAGRDAVMLAEGLLRFCWQAPDLPAADLDGAALAEHLIRVGQDHDGPAAWLPVEPGRTLSLADGAWTLEVEAYLPDFSFDDDTGSAHTASWEAHNPALAVVLTPRDGGTPERRWLFANLPDWGADHTQGQASTRRGPRLVYQHREGAAEESLVVGATRELWRLRAGHVLERVPLEVRAGADDGQVAGSHGLALERGPFGAAVAAVSLSPPSLVPPRAQPGLAPLPGDVRDPGAVVELRDPDGRLSTLVVGVDPVFLPDGGVLMLDERGDGVQAFVSQVSLLVDGEVVDRREVRVNQPLAWGDLHIYQSNFRRDDLAWSGFQVVDDPGLTIVFSGMAMMVLGVAYLLLVRPRLERRGIAP